MKMKTKILLTILPILIIGIISMNIAFGMFFQNFILQSEADKVRVSADYIYTFLEEKLTAYLGTVNDWSHWDDTYFFVENLNDSYVDLNLTESALDSINISFLIILNNDDRIMHQSYYSFEEEKITDFPPDSIKHFEKVLKFSKSAEDVTGVMSIGDSYYIVASSLITDSLEKESANGKLIIGREIDRSMIAQLEKASGIAISDMNVISETNQAYESERPNIVEINYDDYDDNIINIKAIIPNKYDRNASILFSIVMTRDLYIRGMKQAFDFSVMNTIISLIVSFIIFLLLGKFITKPFMELTNDVQKIDLTQSGIHTIPESGKDEFSFLRKSINTLMNKVVNGQNELQESKEEFHTTLISIGEGIITVDNNSKIKFMNPVAEKMTGWSLNESQDEALDVVLIIKEEVGEDLLGNLAEMVFESEDTVKISSNNRVVAKNGETVDVEITAAPIKDLKGAMMGCVLAINDITENRKKQKHIEYLSYRDILTGVYNRSFYEKKLKEFEEKEDASVSMIIIDVNGLKLTNDAFGHETGDRLLIKVAEGIERSIRDKDMVCRIGGDEFVIFLPKADSDEVIGIITRLHAAIEKEKIENIPISVSSGWATKEYKNEMMESIFKLAEDMMYHNKSSDNKSQRHQTIQIIMKTLFEKNPREEAHSKRVSDLCLRIGEQMEMDPSKIKNLQTAGLLHDIGKIGIGNDYLDKAGPLSEIEWLEIRKHPQISHNILSSVNDYGPLADIVLSHHERWDGKGYPNGLAGEEIPLESRIIALADAYDAMISDRPYRNGMKEEEALVIIANEAGMQFDPKVVDIFLEKVMRSNDVDLEQPIT